MFVSNQYFGEEKKMVLLENSYLSNSKSLYFSLN